MTDQAAEHLAMVLLDASSSAAAACEAWVGKGDKNAADFAAVEAMRGALNRSGERFRVAIGEGELDQAPMLNRGEEFGSGPGPLWDLAVDPLEGTELCAHGLPGAVTAIAGGEPGTILSAPDGYMAKIMAGPACPPEAVHVDNPVGDLIRTYAKAAEKDISGVVVCVLDRPRHAPLIEQIRAAGATPRLIAHGDLPAALWVCQPETFGVDLYMGIGGAPEGVLSAVLLKALGGSMSARFQPEDETQAARLADAEIGWSVDHVFGLSQIVSGEAAFAMASVTGTPGLAAARRLGHRVHIEALTVSTCGPRGQRLRYRSTEVDEG